MANVLYISLDGMTDPLGQSQVLPYLTGLARQGHRFHLLSCEKPERLASSRQTIQQICDAAGIQWHPLDYRTFPPVVAGKLNAMALNRAALKLHQAAPFDIIHCRSYIPAIVGLGLKRKTGAKLLFDMRGFWPEEKTEGGSWPQDRLIFRQIYRYFKKRESELLKEADHIVSLTHNGKGVLEERAEVKQGSTPISVIPCCADLDHFPIVTAEARSASRKTLGIDEHSKVLTYLGSVGAWYMLDEMMDLFNVYRQRHESARFLFISPSPEHMIIEAAQRKQIPAASLTIRSASRQQVPEYLAAADASVFFIKPVFSKRASSPTKMGELISMGLPIITNTGVGDIDRIVEETGCGVALSSFNEESYAAALSELETFDFDVSRSRQKARPWFDLENGVARYAAIYASMTGNPAQT